MLPVFYILIILLVSASFHLHLNHTSACKWRKSHFTARRQMSPFLSADQRAVIEETINESSIATPSVVGGETMGGAVGGCNMAAETDASSTETAAAESDTSGNAACSIQRSKRQVEELEPYVPYLGFVFYSFPIFSFTLPFGGQLKLFGYDFIWPSHRKTNFLFNKSSKISSSLFKEKRSQFTSFPTFVRLFRSLSRHKRIFFNLWFFPLYLLFNKVWQLPVSTVRPFTTGHKTICWMGFLGDDVNEKHAGKFRMKINIKKKEKWHEDHDQSNVRLTSLINTRVMLKTLSRHRVSLAV